VRTEPGGRVDPWRLRPAHHHPPQQAEIGQHQTVFETGRREVTGRRQRGVYEHTSREQQRPPPAQAGRIEPGRTQHREHQTRDAEHEGQGQRHILQPHRTGEPAAERDEIRPHRGGVGFHPFTLVEHGTVARQQVSHGAQHDQAVVGNPTALPAAPPEKRGDDQHAHPEADPHCDVVRKGGPTQHLRRRPDPAPVS
jgi:hypothetical protein